MVSSLFLSIYFFSQSTVRTQVLEGTRSVNRGLLFPLCSVAGATWDSHLSGAFLFVEEREVVEDE